MWISNETTPTRIDMFSDIIDGKYKVGYHVQYKDPTRKDILYRYITVYNKDEFSICQLSWSGEPDNIIHKYEIYMRNRPRKGTEATETAVVIDLAHAGLLQLPPEEKKGGNAKLRKIHTGPNGGKYIIKNGKKMYMK